MKIAIVSDTFFPQINGVANVAFDSAWSLSEIGHDVVVFAPVEKNNQHHELYSQTFRTFFLSSMSFFAYPGERITMPISLKGLFYILKFKPEIIHSHTPFGAGWFAYFGAKLTGAKLITTHHTFFDHYLKHIFLDYDFFKKLSWKYVVWYGNRCDVLISPTEALADPLPESGLKTQIAILKNPINTELFFPVDQIKKKELKKKFGITGPSIVYMGRLSYEKSIDVILKAFKLTQNQNINLYCMIIGDGPERENLERLSRELKIENKVIFTGLLRGRELAEALQANDIFVTASKSENMPLSVLEAEATGLPIICPNEKGLVEMVKHNIDGLHVSKDNAVSFTNAIIDLIYNDKKREKMSKAARENSLAYSREAITSELEEIYNFNG